MKSLETTQAWILRILVFLLPLFLLPITLDFIDYNKLALLVVGVLLALLAWALAQTRTQLSLRLTPFDLPVFAFALIVLASALIITPNKQDAFIAPGTASLILAGSLLYFVCVQYFKKDNNSLFAWVLAGGGASALIALLAGTGLLALAANYISLPSWLAQNIFTTFGSPLPALVYFIALLPLSLAWLTRKKISFAPLLVLVLLIGGIAVSAFYLLPGKPASPRFLPWQTGWSISLETLKRSPLLGVGPANFTEAFDRFRPVEFNQTDVWNLRFGSSSNWFFNVWTEAGILGLLAFLWITVLFIRHLRSERGGGVEYSLTALLLLFALIPAGLMLVVLFYVLLAWVAAKLGNDYSLRFATGSETGEHGRNLLPGIIAILSALSLVFVAYRGLPIYQADTHFRRALDAYTRKDGRGVGEEIVKAIQLNSLRDNYRIFFDQVSLESVSVKVANQNLTDDDRAQINALVQQAIREGQAAVSLNQTHADNWINLAQTYQAIMPLARDADRFAISTYQQATFLDPVNPLLRLSLGGVFYSTKQYEEAVKAFELAVAAKGDFANAHYNLAIALRDKGDTARAAQEMATTLQLVQAGSKDAETVQKELDALNKKLSEEASASAKPAAGASSNQPPLEAPAPAESKISPPLNLPEEAAPPTPTPQPN